MRTWSRLRISTSGSIAARSSGWYICFIGRPSIGRTARAQLRRHGYRPRYSDAPDHSLPGPGSGGGLRRTYADGDTSADSESDHSAEPDSDSDSDLNPH